MFEQQGFDPITIEDNGPGDLNPLIGSIDVQPVLVIGDFLIEGYSIASVESVPGFYGLSQSGLILRSNDAVGDVTLTVTIGDFNLVSTLPESIEANASGIFSETNGSALFSILYNETDNFVLDPMIAPPVGDPPPFVELDPQPISGVPPFSVQTQFQVTLGPSAGFLPAEFTTNASLNITGDVLDPIIQIEKLTNGEDADTGFGPILPVGSMATFTYLVTNPGNVPLADIVVTDDQGLPVTFVGGDENGNELLDPGETWTFTASTLVTAGQYTNIGTVTGNSPDGRVVTDDDPSNHFGAAPAINIEKLTNGEDADTGFGPILPVGSMATFTYLVTNPGNVPLADIVVTDDQGLPVTFVGGDENGNDLLDPGETWTFTASTLITAGQYTNIGTVAGTPRQPDGGLIPTPGLPLVTDDDPSNHFGAAPAIQILKLTGDKIGEGEDANVAPGPFLPVGSTAVFTYLVTNTGNLPLANVNVTDDQGVSPIFVNGDTNGNNLLDPGETWTFTASALVTAGQYTNIGTVTGTPRQPDGGLIPTPGLPMVTDDDPSNHFGAAPVINIEKLTNGEDADTATGPILGVGDTATFTYLVTNPGNVPLSGIVVTDDQGLVPVFVGGDANGNNLLDPGETWTFTASTVVTAGQYTNIGTASGNSPDGRVVTDDDPSNHFGEPPPPPPAPTASVSGFVYLDLNENGVFDAGDEGIGGVTILLVGMQEGPAGGAQFISFSTVTAASGFYQFDLSDISFGFFELIEIRPEGLLTSAINVGSLGGTAVEFDAFTNRIGDLLVVGGDAGINYNFGHLTPPLPPTPMTGFLSGTVHLDVHDNDGIFDGVDDLLMANVVINLTGVDDQGQVVQRQTVTDINGNYAFFNLRPGTYNIIQEQPVGFLNGRQRLGSLGGNVGVNRFTAIPLRGGDMGVSYNFAERIRPECRLLLQGFRRGNFAHAGPLVRFHFPYLFDPNAAQAQALANQVLAAQAQAQFSQQPAVTVGASVPSPHFRFAGAPSRSGGR